MKQILSFIFIVLSIFSIRAQDCTTTQAFFTLNKGLVIDFKPTQEELLNKEVLKILSIKEAELCENFGVFDVAHYRMKGYATDGYTEDIAAYKAACVKQKPYYVLFIRKYDENLNLTKIQVELSFPTDKKFSCMTELERNLLKVLLEKKLAEKLALDKSDAWIPEIAAVALLQEEVENVINCCAGRGLCVKKCAYDPQGIFDKISKDRATFSEMFFVDKDSDFLTSSANLSAKLNITIKDKKQSAAIDLDDFIDNFVKDYSEDIQSRFDFVPTTKIVKYKYPRDCNSIDESLDDFDNSSAHFTVHVGIINLDNEVGILMITTSANFTPILSKSFSSRSSSKNPSDEILNDEIDDLKEAKEGKACYDLIGAIFGRGGAYKLKYTNDNYFFYRPEVKKVIDDIVKRSEENVKVADANFAPLWAKEHDIMLKYHLKTDDWGKDDIYWDGIRANLSANWHICGDAIHSILDACGIIDVPPIGPVCDATNALLYLAGGDFQNAALSSVAVIPLIGNSATYSKYAGKLWKSIPCFGNKSASESLGKCPRGVLTFVVDNATGIIEWCGKRAKLKKLMERAADFSYVWIVNGKVFKYDAKLHDAHHVIPWSLCDNKQHPFVKWAAQGGWHPSDPIKNGFPVPFDIHIPDILGGAKNHNAYNDYVEKGLDKLAKKANDKFGDPANLPDAQLKQFADYCNGEMDNLVQELNGKIVDAINKGIPLNSYFK
jgi:hypothetical protein